MLRLPSVTLALIETREHDLAQLALEECESRVKFGDVLVSTDRPSQFLRADRRVISVPDWPEKVGWSRCFWYDVAQHVCTSHVLGIQWDSWIIHPESWRDEFLNYDFIGAPWWYTDGMNVGNGGFSLRSTKFMRYVRKHRDRFPCTNALDDDLYCRKYRIQLQAEGFNWAPVSVASNFAFECVQPSEDVKPFGFHAAFNFGKVLTPERLMERAKLMEASPNISKSKIWKGFAERYPDVIRELEAGKSQSELLLVKEI